MEEDRQYIVMDEEDMNAYYKVRALREIAEDTAGGWLGSESKKVKAYITYIKQKDSFYDMIHKKYNAPPEAEAGVTYNKEHKLCVYYKIKGEVKND